MHTGYFCYCQRVEGGGVCIALNVDAGVNGGLCYLCAWEEEYIEKRQLLSRHIRERDDVSSEFQV